MPKDVQPLDRIDVFISYKKEERDLADLVAQALENSGYRQVSDLAIDTGDSFPLAIDRMIRQARLTVVLWTEASVQSRWVLEEAFLARDLGRYLGVFVDRVELPAGLRTEQGLDLAKAALRDQVPTIIETVTRRIGLPQTSPEIARAQSEAVSDEARFFDWAERGDTPERYEAFLTEYPSGTLAGDARKRLKTLLTWRVWWRRNRNFLATALAAIAAAGALGWQIAQDPDTRGDLGVAGEAALRNEIDTLEARLAEADGALSEVEAALEAQRTAAGTAAAELSSAEERRQSELDALRAEHEAELEALEQQLAEAQAALDAAPTERDADALPASADRSVSPPAPEPDCDMPGAPGARGYTMPARNGSLQCVPTDATELFLFDTNFRPHHARNLSALTSLLSLDLGQTDFATTARLRPLGNLLSLSLTYTPVTDLSPLSDLTRLRYLNLGFTGVTTIYALAKLTELRHLNLNGTEVGNLTPLANLTALHRLILPDGTELGGWVETYDNRAEVQFWLDENVR